MRQPVALAALGVDLDDVDWSGTPLGPVASWSEALRTVTGLVQSTHAPSCLFWGPEGTMIFNAAWAREIGSTAGLRPGCTAARISPELARAYSENLARTRAGEVPDMDSALLPLMWRSLVDRPHAALSCVPVMGDDGAALGLLVQLSLALGEEPATAAASGGTARNAFMLHLSDALRRVDDPDEIQFLGIRMVGQELQADHANFAEIDLAAGKAWVPRDYHRDQTAPSLSGTYDLSDYERAIAGFRDGIPLVIEDLNSEAPIPYISVKDEVRHFSQGRFRATLTVPIRRAGDLVSVMTVQYVLPHRWTANQIATVQRAALRIREAFERARAEQALRTSEERLKRALETDAISVLYFAHDGTLIGSNDVFLRMSGFSRAEVDGRTLSWRDMTPPEWVADSEAQMVTLAETGRIGPYEKEYLRRDGSRWWFLFTGRDLGDGTIVEFAIDISDRKRAEEALRQANLRLRLAEEAAGVGTFDWLIEANESHWSPEFLEMLGLREGTLGGTYEDWVAMIHPEDRAEASRRIDAALETGMLEGEWRVVRPDGTVLWVLIRGVVERDATGRPVRLTGAQVDITERVISESKVRVLMDELDAQIAHLRRQLGSGGA